MKPSGYVPWGPSRSSMVSRMTLSSKSCVRKFLNVLQVPPFLTPFFDTLLIKISTPNFQDIFLGEKHHHSWRQKWPYPPFFWSGTLNVPPSWHTSNWDINTKFSGYLSWCKRTSFTTLGMTLPSMSSVRIPHCPPSISLLDPPSWHTSNWDINTKFSGYLPQGKKHHS